MKQKNLAVALVALMLFFVTSTSGAPGAVDDQTSDTDTRIVDARIVELAEAHISIKARSGVEHVIAVDAAGTKVTLGGETVSLKDIRDGDTVTVDLDAKKAVKFATNIAVRSGQVARVRR